jgi:hypothetical protein
VEPANVISLTSPVLDHFHIDTKRVRKLSRQLRVALFEAVDENLAGRDRRGAVGGDDLA